MEFLSVGEVCPIANATGTYTIDIDLGYSTLPSTNGPLQMTIGVPDDGNYSYSSPPLFSDGYCVLLYKSGDIYLTKVAAGTGGLGTLANKASPALSAGQWAHLTVQVTPTTISVTRTDGESPVEVTATDSTYRGGYLNIGKKDSDGVAQFKALTIT